MLIGIIPNTTKENIIDVVGNIAEKFSEQKIDIVLSDTLLKFQDKFSTVLNNQKYMPEETIFANSEIVVSIGGDGTMLNTAYHSLDKDVPIIGVNFGKLGFLAEYDINDIEKFIKDIKNKNYFIEERIVLEAYCTKEPNEKFFAINDIVIEKGEWPKMIEQSIYVDDKYVTSFLADGLIIATPTGSTGYSLSVGGPIVCPNTDVITISPISAHSLTMRPIVLSSVNEIKVIAKSQHKNVQLSFDGQRVKAVSSPIELVIKRSSKNIKLLHTQSINYFEVLRKKLLWGLDVRNNN